MKNALTSRIVVFALAVSLIASLGFAPARAQDGCWDNSAIQSAVSSGEILPVASVLSREGIPSSTEVLNVRVCEEGGSIVYVLSILEASGEARNLTVSAQ